MKKMVIRTAAAALLLCPAASLAQEKEITVDMLQESPELYPSHPAELRSLSDGESYAVISDDGKRIESFSYASGKKTATLVDLDSAKGDKRIDEIDGYEISQTGDFILIWGNKERIYRRSYTADHYILDVAHNTLLPLSKDGKEQEATFAPNGFMVSYVKDNDLNIYKLRYQTSSKVTTDGERNKIINGVPDWVNEEEFSKSRSYAWSPDSKKLAYVKYDETDVAEYSFPMYAASNPRHDGNALYPGEYTYKYPKAGEKNSKVSVHIFDIDTRVTKEVDLGKEECYVPRIEWTGQPDQLAVFRLNRMQNRMDVIGVNAKSLVTLPLLTERDKSYIDEPAYQKLTFINEGKDFVAISERDGWSHLYLYGINGDLKRQLTKGEYDVTDYYGYDEKSGTIYYQAAGRTPMEREVYALNLKKQTTTRIAGSEGTNSAQFSEGCRYFVWQHSSVTTPPTYRICDSKGKTLRTMEDNTALRETLKEYYVAKKEFTTIAGADGTMLNAWVVKPRGFDEKKSYPVLMTQYSGPNSQEVLNRWDLDWEQSLAYRGYMVVCVDGRGTGARGADFRKCTYQQLGRLESDDQIAAAKQLASLPYVDSKRIGIWGWSFGGFMSTLCMCKSDVFAAGIAVAPVINWRFYDSVYTERYLRRPDQNESGYDKNSPLTYADKMSGKYFIIAGTADDNVHYQNQMEMVDALVQAGKQFRMFSYPNRNHSIYGGKVRSHLYNMMLSFVEEEL